MDAPPPNPQADELLAQSQAAALRGEHREGARLAEAALALIMPQDLPRRALAQRWIALHQMRLGQPQGAVPAAFEAIALCRDLRDAAGEADALNTLSLTCHRLGLPRETVAYALQALAIARAQGDLRTECWAHGRAGIGYEALARIFHEGGAAGRPG
jgi:tetratricopeptide (TPR) repeat protein